jgi:hypothetical protein
VLPVISINKFHITRSNVDITFLKPEVVIGINNTFICQQLLNDAVNISACVLVIKSQYWCYSGFLFTFTTKGRTKFQLE